MVESLKNEVARKKKKYSKEKKNILFLDLQKKKIKETSLKDSSKY